MEPIEEHNGLLVRKIENGTVIDHVAAWRAEVIVKVLRLDRLMHGPSEVSLAILSNVVSKKLGRKDVIKVENWLADENIADMVCLIEPTATVNYIKNWRATKYVPKVPKKIEGRLRCPQLQCITNSEREPIITKFSTFNGERLLQCDYCNVLLELDKIPELVMA